MATNLVNLTPHALTLRLSDGSDLVVPPSGTVARVATKPGALTEIPGVPVPVATATEYGEIEGLPAPVEGVVYLVGALVLGRAFGRADVFGPGTGPNDGAIREPELLEDGTPNPKKGQIVAVTRLIAAPKG